MPESWARPCTFDATRPDEDFRKNILFCPSLNIIRQMLPATAATLAENLTRRRYPEGGGACAFQDLSLQVRFLVWLRTRAYPSPTAVKGTKQTLPSAWPSPAPPKVSFSMVTNSSRMASCASDALRGIFPEPCATPTAPVSGESFPPKYGSACDKRRNHRFTCLFNLDKGYPHLFDGATIDD